jgi:deoxyribose-phosphate aldolase
MLATRSIKTSSKRWAIDTAISMVDLTTLEGADTAGKVRALCSKAVRPDPTDSTVPSVGAICVYNDMVAIARTHLDAIGGQARSCCCSVDRFPIRARIYGSERFKIPKMR